MSTTTAVTFAEFEALPDLDCGKQELIDGEVITLPPAKFAHARLADRMARILRKCFGDEERVYLEMGYKFDYGSGAWLQPDASVLYPDQAVHDYLEGPPMIAIEVISASNRPAYVARKVRIYLDNGGGEVWVVYPKSQHVMVHRPNESPIRFDDKLVSSLLFGFEMLLSQVFSNRIA